MGSTAVIEPTKKTVILITEPTLKSKRFEDQVKVIRIFNPDEERMVSALRYVLNLPVRAGAQR